MILDDLIENRVAVKCTLKSEFDDLDFLLQHCSKDIHIPPPVEQYEVDDQPYYFVHRKQAMTAKTLKDARDDTHSPYLIELSYAQFMFLYNNGDTMSDLHVDLSSIL